MTAHIPLEAAVTAYQPPKASSPFLGYLGLITNGQDPPLMSVRAALSVRVLSKEVVRSQKSPKVMLTGSADVSSEVAELVSGFLEAVEPTDVSPEAAVSAHRASEAAASSHSAPDTAMPTHTAPEAVEPADMSPEVAGLASGPLEAVEPTDVSSETRCSLTPLTKLSTRRCPLTQPPKQRCPPAKPPTQRCPPTQPPKRWCPPPLHGPAPPHPFPYSAPALPFPWLEAWERLDRLPLTARRRYLPSSWTHQLHSTHLFTHSSLPAGLNLWTIYTPHPHPSGRGDYPY